jgi:hypothetical protein
MGAMIGLQRRSAVGPQTTDPRPSPGITVAPQSSAP